MYSCVTYTCTVSSDLMDDVNVNSRPNLALVKDNCGPVHSGLATFLPGCFNHKTTCSKIMMGTTGFGFAGVFVCLFFFPFPYVSSPSLSFAHLYLFSFVRLPWFSSRGQTAEVRRSTNFTLYCVLFTFVFQLLCPHCVIGPVFASF